jgi:large subunit ribosomal protein L24
MKKKFSIKWLGSKQPRKQRKYRANAPLHRRAKMLSSNLNKELRKKYNRRSFTLRKGDSVLVMNGEFKTKKGKISSVNLSKLKVAIDGLQKTKKDGTKVNILFDPSNLQIQELNLDDKMRMKSISKDIGNAQNGVPLEDGKTNGEAKKSTAEEQSKVDKDKKKELSKKLDKEAKKK